jgi:plasmid stabilization system protein ParE
MKVRYTVRAFADREAIYDYLEKRSPQGARNIAPPSKDGGWRFANPSYGPIFRP